MSNTIYLYLKTHNNTGLKYFGMTKQDPQQYLGSGKRWRNHLSKHGYDITTEIIFESENKEEISRVGKYYSALWNVVESDEFANLKIEEGDGGFDHINNCVNMRKYVSERSSAANKGKGGMKHRTDESYQKFRQAGKTSFLGKHHTEETKIKISEANKINQLGEKNSNYGKVWCVKIGAISYEERKLFSVDNIPNGWISCKEHRDQKKSKTNPAYGRSWFNDGKINYFLTRDDPKINFLGLEKRRIR